MQYYAKENAPIKLVNTNINLRKSTESLFWYTKLLYTETECQGIKYVTLS